MVFWLWVSGWSIVKKIWRDHDRFECHILKRCIMHPRINYPENTPRCFNAEIWWDNVIASVNVDSMMNLFWHQKQFCWQLTMLVKLWYAYINIEKTTSFQRWNNIDKHKSAQLSFQPNINLETNESWRSMSLQRWFDVDVFAEQSCCFFNVLLCRYAGWI